MKVGMTVSNMNKMRVYELAKELGYSSKDFLDMLRNMGVDARSNFSVLEDPTVKRVRETVKHGGDAPESESPAPTPEPVQDEKPLSVPSAPVPAAPQAVSSPARRGAAPTGSGTMITTIDPAAAAAMTMARSSTGPKPKPGGEVRRIIPATKVDALRTQGVPTARPTEAAATRVTVARPEGTAPLTRPAAATPGIPATAQRTVTPGAAPSRPAATPAATPSMVSRPSATGSAASARPTAVPSAPPPRPLTGAAPAAGASSAAGAARPTAAAATSASAQRPAGSMTRPAASTSESATKVAPSTARPQSPAPVARPAAAAGVAGASSRAAAGETPSAPMVRSAPPPTPVPVTPESLQGASTAPPLRPLRGSGPAVRPMAASGPAPQRPQTYQPQRPGGGGRGGRFGGRPMDRGGAPGRKKGSYGSPAPPTVQAPAVELKDIELPDHISVIELASKLEIQPAEIIKTLMSQGLLVTINQTITFDKAQGIAVSHGFNALLTEEHEEVTQESEKEEDLVTRPPVVTVLGHVDHGKTSLLDAIRNTNVTAGEAGGITQSIGAYVVDHDGRKITFIDTPGHEAFTAMRARGAKVTDVAVLVVAADDGIMPQTVEAINHAKAAKVPIVVAINKIDKPNANVDKVKQQLTEYELVPEDWGGTTITCPISAKQRQGIDELLEMILLVADMQELKANPDRKAQGIIIEAKLDKGLGPVATVLVQAGTLKVNDAVVVGQSAGKVRAIINDHGKRIGKVPPGVPGEIIGLSTVPSAGDLLQVVDDEKVARQISEARGQRTRERGSSPTGARTSLDDLFNKMQAGEIKDLNLIVKADNQGSVEALKHSLLRLTDEEVKVNVVHGGVGTITESDILLATASNAIIIGFNVRPDPNVKKLADQEGVDIRSYRVIYNVIEDIQAAMKGMWAPEFHEVQLGRLEVRQVFKVSKIGTIAGCYVSEGKVVRSADVRVLHDSVVVYEGKIDSLKRFKDDVREVTAGYECGLSIEKFPGILVGDIIEVFKMEEKPRE